MYRDRIMSETSKKGVFKLLLSLLVLSDVVMQVTSQRGRCERCTHVTTRYIASVQYSSRRTCTWTWWFIFPYYRCTDIQTSYTVSHVVHVTDYSLCSCSGLLSQPTVQPQFTNVAANDSSSYVPTSTSQEASPGPSAGAIVGVVLIVIFGVVAIVIIIVIVAVIVSKCVRKRQRKQLKQHNSSTAQGDHYELVNDMHGTIRNADVLQEGLSTRVTQSAEYDAIAVVHHSDVMQEAYHYVPSYKERVGGLTKKTPTANDDIYAAVEAKYQNCIKSSDKDNAKYKEPSSKLEELYDDLAAMQCLEIPRNYLKFGSTLGSGEFGVVCKGEWLTPQGPREVALKVSHEDVPDTEKVKLLQEAAIMKQFNHPNVVRLLGTVTVSEPPVLVVQYMKNGCLHLHLSELPKEMTELRKKQFLQFSFQIAQGMRYLSNKGFIHRDLATRNVLLDQELECKISDFGLSRNLDENTYYMVTSGKIPLKWTAPEALFYKKFSTSSDVWSYGMTLFEIWSFGESPFAQLSLEDLVQQFNVRLNNDNEEHGQVHPLPEDCPNDMNTLILRCWQFNHHRRPTFCDVVTALESLIN